MDLGHINRLAIRVRRMVGLAVINLVDDTLGHQRAQVDLGPKGADGPMQLRDNTWVLQHFGFTSNPPPGSDAAIIALGGEASQVVVIASGHRQYRLTGLPSGAVAIYDMFGHYVRLDADGIHILGATDIVGDVTITGNVTVTGDTALTGDLAVTGDTTLTGETLADGDLTVTGDTALDGFLHAIGDILDHSGSNAVTVASVRAAYNAHKHGGVQAGGAVSGVSDHIAT